MHRQQGFLWVQSHLDTCQFWLDLFLDYILNVSTSFINVISKPASSLAQSVSRLLTAVLLSSASLLPSSTFSSYQPEGSSFVLSFLTTFHSPQIKFKNAICNCYLPCQQPYFLPSCSALGVASLCFSVFFFNVFFF